MRFRSAISAITAIILASGLFFSCRSPLHSPADIVMVSDGHFVSSGKTEYFMGTNFWYGAILASEGRGGDRERLSKELDSLCALGLKNLRVLVGGDGPDGVPTRVDPNLQKAPGVYNDTIFQGLDYLLYEMGKRGMKAVLYVNNSWEWSGGYSMYLEWAGEGKAILPSVEGYGPFMEQVSRFAVNDAAKELFFNHLGNVVGRVNSITGKPYSEDPAIFSWQIGNEPRCFSSDPSVKEAFVQWLWKAASIIKSIDPNHMVSTGNEGEFGCENDMALYERIHSCPDIDYLTIHVWPYNWNWIGQASPQSGIENAKEMTGRYIDSHVEVARRLGKPLVMEEFGFPRDDFKFDKSSSTTGRDAYYKFVFDRLISSRDSGGPFSGLNFWAWGGYAQPAHEFWQRGDDYTGDPGQEAQGLNSVFATDLSTISLIRSAQKELGSKVSLSASMEDDWMFEEGASQRPLVLLVKSENSFKGKISVSVDVKTDKGEDYLHRDIVVRVPKDAEVEVPVHLGLVPGFYKVGLSTEGLDPKDHSFVIGCSPENIVSPQDKQPDFDSFWEESLAALSGIPLQARISKIPERSTPVRSSYLVEMTSFGGKRIFGQLVMPNAEGKYPVIINYPGYGSSPWWPDPDASPSLIEFTLGPRDQLLDLDPARDWITRGLDDRYSYYYRGAFLDCVRGVDFVCSLPNVDKERILAEGGSQGGALTLVAASLDHRIKAIAPFVPFLSDFVDYMEMASWPWSDILPAAQRLGIGKEELLRTLSYFDVKNFTDRIQCPVLMGVGLQDDVCPPHTNFSGYNMITSPKSWKIFPLSGHHVEQEDGWWEARNAFFSPFLSQ